MPAPVGAVTVIVPVGVAQVVGWVKVTVGAATMGLMTTSADASEIHPAASVTVKLYVPAAKPVMVVVVPVPVIAPGLIVQVPVAGNPLNTTLPVPKQVSGCVIAPTPTIGVATSAGLM